jgi:hypothetical protein
MNISKPNYSYRDINSFLLAIRVSMSFGISKHDNTQIQKKKKKPKTFPNLKDK